MSHLTNQIQDRLDRLERMEPVFEALREALQSLAVICVKGGKTIPKAPTLDEVWKGRAALALAEEVGK